MSAKADRRVIWDPRRQNRFIVGGGSQISLYGWNPSSSGFSLITARSEFQLMKCFSWSPDPVLEDLVAVGSTSGRVDLWRLESNRFSKHNVVTGGPETSLPLRNQRSCNALAFCPVKPNVLAVGLDKVRNEPSLVIWDVGSISRSAASSNIGQRDNSTTKLNSYATAELVSTVSFFPSSADLLVAGVAGLWLRVYDLRSNKHVQEAQAAKIQGIVTDPFDINRIACYNENTISIYDQRKMLQPLLSFTLRDAMADGARPQQAGVFVNAEFSPVRKGVLATLSKDSTSMRFWDIQHSPSADIRPGSEGSRERVGQKDALRSSKLSRITWSATSTILPWNDLPEQPYGHAEISGGNNNVVLSSTRQSKRYGRSIASFAFVPSSENHPFVTNVVVTTKEGDIWMSSMHDAPKNPVWSPRGDLAIGAGTRYRIFPGFSDTEPVLEPWEMEAKLKSTHRERSIDRQSNRKGNTARPLSRTGHSTRPNSSRHGGGSPRTPSYYSDEPLYTADYYGRENHIQHLHNNRPNSMQFLAPHDIANTDPTSQLIPRARRGHGVSGRKRLLNTGRNVIEKDISMMMRSRLLHGYRLLDIAHNVKITAKQHEDNLGLSEVWAWLKNSKELLAFDFAYQGILSIWEGHEPSASRNIVSSIDGLDLAGSSEKSPIDFGAESPSVDVNASLPPRLPSHKSVDSRDSLFGSYTTDSSTMNSRDESDTSAANSPTTSKSRQRQLSLAICDWKVGDDEFGRWEKEGKHSQVACWLLFMRQESRALEVLMRSKMESHQLMSGTFAAVLRSGSSSKELRDHCARLIIKLQDPHFRVMLSYIVFNDWTDVLEETALPLRERLAIALRFLDDKLLSSYLRRAADECRAKGNVEGLVLTGLTSQGLDILQGYVDNTGDIQTAAMLVSYINPSKHADVRVERWVEAYRDLLDGWRLFHYRCQFDIDRGQSLQRAGESGDAIPTEWAKRQFLIRCNFCNNVINAPQRTKEPVAVQRRRNAACPSCGRDLIRCSVCLMSIALVPDFREGKGTDMLHSSFRDTIDDAFIFCQTCRHGGHATHINEWFFGQNSGFTRRTCPVVDCDCYCAE